MARCLLTARASPADSSPSLAIDTIRGPGVANRAIWLGAAGGTDAARRITNPVLERIATMQHISPTELTTVVGGTTTSDQITQQLTSLQTSLTSAASNTSNSSGSGSTMMMMAMMMAMRPQQPTVVAAAAPTAVAAGPVVNINTRVRHW